ncbi:MAG: RNA ligase [Cardiobacteriaceae bacterium]|nr:RNA ligase [Cardiobacteriaceae bacterium]
MKKFILLRGHQGSGKTTFAKEKIADFQKTYPDAQVIHIENDLLMTDEKGIYHFSDEAIGKAQRQGMTMMKEACKRSMKKTEENILIINSNTNQKSSACIHLMQLARKHHFEVEVYRLHNFFPNQHNVREVDVLAAYIKLNHNRLREDIDVPPTKPMDTRTEKLIAEMEAFVQEELVFDDVRQTYVTEKYLRCARRDYIAKTSQRYPELRILKYARSVFYENRFDDALLEMRGLIIDTHNNIIVRPFKKVFNYSERIAQDSKYPLVLHDSDPVEAVVKVNGFLGCCTYVDLPPEHLSYTAAFNKQILYSTTGSLDSSYADMVRIHCQKYEALFRSYPNHTFLFEINDASDVHIIKETLGETLIGIIEVATGNIFTERELNTLAAQYNATQHTVLRRPTLLETITFSELKTLVKTVEHEGFMVFDAKSKMLLCKLKSPYYLISKFLGRSNAKNLSNKLDKKHVSEEYYPLIDYIYEHCDVFNIMTELEKIDFIQKFLKESV